MDSNAGSGCAVARHAATAAEVWRVGVAALFRDGHGDAPRSNPGEEPVARDLAE